MKYIDEKRMRFGYIGIFALAVVLVGGAIWDSTYNDERMLNWFISGLGGLLLIAIFFFIATELILKDALDLRPRPIAAVMDADSGGMPSQNQIPSKIAYRATEPAANAAPATASLEAPKSDAKTLSSRVHEEREPWTPNVQPAVTKASKREKIRIEVPKELETPLEQPKKTPKEKEPVRIEVPDTVVIAAKPPEAKLEEVLPKESITAIPKPAAVPSAPHGVNLETVAYEVGTSQFRVPRGAKGHRNPNAILESTRVLCGDCGLYFRVDLDRARPMSVQCPQCDKDLGLSGAKAEAEHIKMRCRYCGDFLQMPRVSEHKSTQCATCGQING